MEKALSIKFYLYPLIETDKIRIAYVYPTKHRTGTAHIVCVLQVSNTKYKQQIGTYLVYSICI